MALENLIAYAVALGLPLWLVVEEIRHRAAPRRAAETVAAAAAPALERRAAEGAPVRGYVSAA
jgi:hypothetical protein